MWALFMYDWPSNMGCSIRPSILNNTEIIDFLCLATDSYYQYKNIYGILKQC